MSKEDGGLTRIERAFADEVKRLREDQGWTQEQFAELLRIHDLPYVTQSTVSRIENKSRPVRLLEAQAISRVFKRTVSSLMDPDSREAWLHSVDKDHAGARRNFGQFREAAFTLAKDQQLMAEDLAALEAEFQDTADLDEETREYLEHVLLNMRNFVGMDLAAEFEQQVAGGRASASRSISWGGVIGKMASQRRARRGEHKEAP